MSAEPEKQAEPVAPEPIPEALVDALFDRELSPEARRHVLSSVRHDAHARREIERTAEALAALRDQPVAPDLTQRILSRADGRRRFLPRRLRRFTRAARLGVSGASLLMLLAVAGAQRAWPGAFSLSRTQAPLGLVDDAIRGDALQSTEALRAGVDQARNVWTALPVSQTHRAGLLNVSVERSGQAHAPPRSEPRAPALYTLYRVGEAETDEAGLIVGPAMLMRAQTSTTDLRVRFERGDRIVSRGRADELRGVVP